MNKFIFLVFLLSLPLGLAAEPMHAKEALSEALYTEEVSRDPEGAAKQYAEILDSFNSQRAHASTALFRLAEIRNKQGNTKEAIRHYQSYLSSFSDLEPQATLARDQLAKLGGEVPASSPATPSTNAETQQLAVLRDYLKTAPDRIHEPGILEGAVSQNQLEVIDFLLSHGVDPLNSKSLELSVENGFLDATKKLISHSKISDSRARKLVFAAYQRDRRFVLDYFLEQGFPTTPGPDDFQGNSLLMIACVRNDKVLVDKLIQRGSPLDWVFRGRTPSLFPITNDSHRRTKISPLMTAIHADHLDLAAYLLEKGASATLAGPLQDYEDIQAIHFLAAHSTKEAIELMKSFIAHGADPNAEITKNSSQPSRNGPTQWPDFPLKGTTPLEIAIERGSTQMVNALIEEGATPKPHLLIRALPSLEVFEALLTHGADPNANTLTNDSITYFEHLLGRSELTEKHLELLIAHGATLDPDDVFQNPYADVKDHFLPILRQKFLYPELAKSKALTIFNTRNNRLLSVTPSSPESVPLPSALFLWRLPEMLNRLGAQGNQLLFPNIRLFRDGKPQEIDLSQLATIPQFNWGDVIVINSRSLGNSQRSTWSNEACKLMLRKQIDFTVQVSLQDETFPVRIQGDRLSPDLKNHFMPLLSARNLINHLIIGPNSPWSAEEYPIQIRRKDGTLFATKPGSTAGVLEPDDHLQVSLSPKFNTPRSAPENIRVFSSNYPFRHTLAPERNITPTLFEVLANITTTFPHELASSLSTNPAEATSQAFATHNPYEKMYLPHPDFSKVRVILVEVDEEDPFEELKERGMKKNEDGSYSIDFNLTEIIENLPPDATRADLAKLDIPLKNGDVVDIPVFFESLDQAWEGYDENQSRFFNIVMSGQIGVETPEGKVLSVPLRWAPLQFQTTDIGRLPFRSGEEAPCTNMKHLLDSVSPETTNLNLERDDLRYDYARSRGYDILLRHGDYVRLSQPSSTRQPVRRMRPR